jgi:peptidoglycan-N-acetylglucosamine deacetylase
VRAALALGVALAVIPAAAIAAVPYEGEAVERVPSETQVALTFDESLGEETRPILRILRQHDAPSTFFQVGRQVRDHPELAQAIVRQGHEFANHSWRHRDMTQSAHPGRSLRKTQRIAQEVTGTTPDLFRAPQGQADERVIRVANRQGMTVVRWSLAAMDWTLPPAYIVGWVTQELEPGEIVVFHQVSNSREALPEILDWIEEQGWEAVTVGELLDSAG